MIRRPSVKYDRRASTAIVLLGAVGSAFAAAPAPTDRASHPDAREMTPSARLAVDNGLAWLAAIQAPDGSFGSTSNYGRHVGLTALSGLAFMSDGNAPGRGKYGENVDACVRFILVCSGESGLLAAETSHGPMYGHGFATLFLAEIFGMSNRPGLDEAVHKAVRLIVNTQNHQGGWRYQPVQNDADISVTICQVMALRAARNVGIHVPKGTIDSAIEYVRQSQNDDGGFRYMLNSGSSAFARSAAGVATLLYAGVYRDDAVERGLEYLMQFLPSKSVDRNLGHYLYGHYYAAQAMYLSGSSLWSQWYPAIRDELVDAQQADGYWRGQAGNEYGTAMALIVLQMPNRLLPIFQK